MLITAILFLFAQSLLSQGYQKGNFQGTMPMDGKITGTIIDSITGQPVEYAIVAIHKMKDSSLVTGSSTKTNGSFIVEGLPYGRFYAEITFVGYKKHVVRGILITPNQNSMNIGSVKIEPSSTDINAVVVTGNKPAIEYKLDKKVVDVTQNVVATGGTVVDALQNIPSIQTDVEGNVTLRGSSNFTVLIDGKPSPLTGSEALQQIPASTVQNVEIITNPSAKYDAEGSAGIINVVMKKQNVKGMNGIFNVTAGTGDKYGANMNLNYKFSKFNFTLGVDYTDMKYAITSYTNNSYVNHLKDSLVSRTNNGTGNFHRKGKGIKLGVDYNINDNSTISLMGNVGSRDMYRPGTNYFNDVYPYSSSYYITNSINEAIRNYYNLNLDYQLKLGNNGQQLSASAYLNAGPDNVPSSNITDTTNSNWVSTQNIKTQPQIQIAQNSNETEFRGKVDYTLPIGEKGKLETGYQGRYYQNNGSYSTTGNINVLEQLLNAKDQIQAAYISFSNSSFIDYQLGFRTEYEIRDIKYGNNDNKMEKPFYEPTIHLSKELPWDLQLQASFTRRIDRPREWNLNPVPRYTSLTSIMVGNPNLQPDVASSYELNLMKKINDASFVSAESFYRQTDNLMYPMPSHTYSGLDSTTYQNINHDRSIGAEFMINLAPAKWFNFNASLTIYNYQIFGMPVIPNVPQVNNINTGNIKVNPTFRMPWGMGIQIMYTYNAPTINATGGHQSSNYSSGIGVKQELLKRKASLTMQVQNLIGFTRVTSTSYSNSQTTMNWFQRESKVFLFTFSYRINNYKVQKAKTQQDDNSSAPDTDMMGNP